MEILRFQSSLTIQLKKPFFNLLKKVLVFQKTCFRVRVLKIVKISSDCYIKTCRSLKRRAILKIRSTVNETSKKKHIPVIRQKPT